MLNLRRKKETVMGYFTRIAAAGSLAGLLVLAQPAAAPASTSAHTSHAPTAVRVTPAGFCGVLWDC
jgi:hypothetical protein